MGKRLTDLKKKLDAHKTYTVEEAVDVIKSNANAKFDETIDLAINLNIDTKKTDQNVRGSVMLPNGTGRKCIVAVFAKGEKAEEAKKAGADIVGADDLVEKIQKDEVQFDACVATPDMMLVVGKVARVLGPKGLMPNPKLGTVTNDLDAIIKSLKAGRVNLKNDKGGTVHSLVGKASFGAKELAENIKAVLETVNTLKPSGVKGTYLKNMYLSSTHGPSVLFVTA